MICSGCGRCSCCGQYAYGQLYGQYIAQNYQSQQQLFQQGAQCAQSSTSNSMGCNHGPTPLGGQHVVLGT